MARKPTGNPLGRPPVYSEADRPLTVSLRIPRDLADRMKHYAFRHRQTVTELLLDGLRWRLEQEDPRFSTVPAMLHYDNAVLQELAKPVHFLDDHMPFDEDLSTGAPAAARVHTYSGLPEKMHEEPLRATGEETPQTEDAVPAYDTSKYVLGELCVHGHHYHGTGHSLRRRSDRECLACQKERTRAARQRKRQAQPA